MKKLVVVESPAKAKTIQKYLGKEYTVIASKGHIVDLPKSGLAVDVEKGFDPEYIVTKPTVLKELKKEYKQSDELVLAVDPDREGEAIGWHIAQQLGAIDQKGNPKKGNKITRIVFTEITESAVKHAAANPRLIDMDLVNAQQARRVLDRLVGYKLSPLLWKKIRYGLSAGRVQSVAVRLIVDRERERDAFRPDEYWKVMAGLKDKKVLNCDIQLKLKGEDAENDETEDEDAQESLFELNKYKGKKYELTSANEAQVLLQELKTHDWYIVEVQKKLTQKSPPTPFNTSTLQQVAANKLGFAAKRTMQTAQKLYEAGQITYMRTDSLSLSVQAIQDIRKVISKLGKQYLPEKPNEYKTRSKVAQEAHEAIRPTNPKASASDLALTGDAERLYSLIRNRAVASQMMPAQIEVNTVTAKVGDYEFGLTGRTVAFDGYLKIYHEKITESDLPDYKKGQQVYPEQLRASQHFTQPPARYSEASLIKTLESLGIGRPSTYAPIIQTIQTRQYVLKENKYFTPTDTGIVVTDLLVKYFPDIVDASFTATMEDKLDEIANGELNWVKMLGEFYTPFDKDLINNDKKIKKDEFTVLGKAPKDIVCPECGGEMEIKLGRFGRFYSCVKFPECKGMRSIDGESEEDVNKKAGSEEFLATYLPGPKTEDDRLFLLKKGRFGEFWAHPDYPKVKDARPLELRPEKMIEVYGEIPKTDDGRDYLIKSGKFGKFWAHPDYPKVKDIIKIKKQ